VDSTLAETQEAGRRPAPSHGAAGDPAVLEEKLETMQRLYAVLAGLVYVDDGRGELEGGCRSSLCRFIYARTIMARIVAEPRPVLDVAALLATYGISPMVTEEHAGMIRSLIAAALEAPEGLRSTSIFTAIASLPDLGLPAATLPLFLLEPRHYPLYDDEYARGLTALLEAAGSDTKPPRPEEIREAARAKNQPRVASLYREAARAHMEALRLYASPLETLGYPATEGLLAGIALDALARTAARGHASREELRAALAATQEIRQLHRALRFTAGARPP